MAEFSELIRNEAPAISEQERVRISDILSQTDKGTDGVPVVKEDLDFLLEHFGPSFRLKSPDPFFPGQVPYISRRISNEIFKHGDEDQKKKAKEIVSGLCAEQEPAVKSGAYYALIGVKLDEIRDIVAKQLSDMNLDPESLFSVWSRQGKAFSGSELRSLWNLLDMERERPGIGKVLQSEFGINNFNRYPTEVLIRQYDQRNFKDRNTPFGICMFPKDDYNGVFTGALGQMLKRAIGRTEGKCVFRIWEVGSALELVEILNRSRKKYDRASFMVIAGHGEENLIEFSETDPRSKGRLRQDQVARKGAEAMKQAFIDNPTVILSSCSTGALGGIGEAISKIGCRVIAPDVPIESIINLNITIENGLVKSIKPIFSSEEEDKFAINTYQSGVIESGDDA